MHYSKGGSFSTDLIQTLESRGVGNGWWRLCVMRRKPEVWMQEGERTEALLGLDP